MMGRGERARASLRAVRTPVEVSGELMRQIQHEEWRSLSAREDGESVRETERPVLEASVERKRACGSRMLMYHCQWEYFSTLDFSQ
jgi:hypothetical protein